MKRMLRFVLLGWGVMALLACVGPSTHQLPSVVEIDSGIALADLKKDLETARTTQLDVLAPGPYQKARTAYQKAMLASERNERKATIQSHLVEAHRQLDQAEHTGEVARTILAEIRDARQKAFDAGAKALGEPFNQVEVHYVRVTQAIENDNIDFARDNVAKLKQMYRSVEIMAIKERALGAVRALMLKAEKEGVEKNVPKAYKEAIQVLAQADAYVEQKPYESKSIQNKAADALFMIQRSIALSRLDRHLRQMDDESTVVYLETQMARLAKSLDSGDLRNLAFVDQVSTLCQAAEKIRAENQSLVDTNYAYQHQIKVMEERISGLKGAASQQEVTTARLQAERAFNNLFDQVQKSFSHDEAEVYRQGNQLVIRLRGIQFPVGTATLAPENFGLLAKVKKAIETFGQAKVLVEGHTDNSGSPEKNQFLSQERAEAVRSYLVANSSLAANRIHAIGHGPDRPLAGNDTVQGRAINRRIDVKVTPDNQP